MLHRFSRTELLIGKEGLDKLAGSSVAVFGLGGVGSYTVEALARAGVGRLVLVDFDEVCLTNINRQLHALQDTVGKPKTSLMEERVKKINPKALVTSVQEFYSPEKSGELLSRDYDYVVDAIDSISSKIDLIKKCIELKIPIVSAMGAGNKMDPTAFKVADISETSVDPLAKVVRRELRRAGIKKGLKVVFSTEQPKTPRETVVNCRNNCICTNKDAVYNCTMKRQIPGSISFVPPVMGLILAGVVVNDLLRNKM